MANNDNTQVIDPIEEQNAVDETAADQIIIPEAKTKKELKKERKEIKKHKKEVQKEAKLHSATRTKAENFWLSVISIFVVVCMVACTGLSVKTYMNISKGVVSDSGSTGGSSSAGSSSSAGGSSSTGSSSSAGGSSSTGGSTSTGDSTGSENSAGTPSGDSGAAAGDQANADLSTKEGIVAYYKAAHAKVLSSAKSVVKTYDNTLNYNQVLEIGGNDTLAGIAQSLMGQFMKEDTEEHPFSGADIAANFPPAGKDTSGLTPDMVSEATCTEENGKYIIKIKINSTEDNYDTGAMTGNLVTIVNESDVTNAAGSLVSLDGLENRYVGANITATIDKATGNLETLETYAPSYMYFAQATAAFVIKVNDCRIGLEYQQKWRVEY